MSNIRFYSIYKRNNNKCFFFLIIIIIIKTKNKREKKSYYVKFFHCTGYWLVEFKHMVALSNKTQIMLSFPIIIKINIIMCFNSIRKPNVPNLRNFI